ncbi:hypothetical protein HYX06_06115 [Candidatus Woesearchaeota archaeon]|nr:hypothetical protein [Candidatus Woesearchaeota archaeon]
MAKEKHFKYYKNIIYKGDKVEISTERTRASLDTLTLILKDGALRRKDILFRTGWTRGQLAGLLYRGIKQGLFKLKNRQIYAIKK